MSDTLHLPADKMVNGNLFAVQISGVDAVIEIITRAALLALAHHSPERGCAVYIRTVAKHMGVDYETARWALRRLRAEGQVRYTRGLFRECGRQTAGAGYELTETGWVAVQALTEAVAP